jgi:peptidoglycan/LPS O-acetylase OafA/YrhL
VKRQLTMPLSMVWLATVVAAWLVTMPLLVLLIRVTVHHASVGDLVGRAALSATFACVFVGGPVIAVALRVRRNHSQRRAVLSGVATGSVVLLFFYSYVAAAGTPVGGAWKALLPLVVVTVAELALALRLRRYCPEPDPPAAPPSQQPPDQPDASP